jgi:hypothetical protein
VRFQIGVGQARHFGGGEGNLRPILAQVTLEGLAQRLQLHGDLLHATAPFGRQRDAVVFECFDEILLELRLARVGRLRRFHACEELLALQSLGRQGRVLLQAPLRGVTHGPVRMHVAEQPHRVQHVLDRDLEAIPFSENGAGAALRFHDASGFSRRCQRASQALVTPAAS